MNDIKKCPYCGKQLHTDAQYCMFCMHSLQNKKDVTPKKRSGSFIVLLFVIIAALLLTAPCVGGCLIAVTGFVGNSGDRSSLSVQIDTEELASKTENSSEQPLEPEKKPAESMAEESAALNSEVLGPFFSKPDSKPVVTDPEPSKPGTVPTVPGNSEPIVTAPSETEPKQTQPEQTQPEQTQPCSHYYTEATCAAPMTCTLCGDTRGTVDDNAHNWEAVTATVHHKEVGHYEEQTDYVKKTKYLCFFCGYNQDGFYSMDALREHITVHSHYGFDYDLIVKNLESHTDTYEVWEPVTETVWVVDQKAFDETIVTGYTCSICKEHKETE